VSGVNALVLQTAGDVLNKLGGIDVQRISDPE
jgi:hypothetical protein